MKVIALDPEETMAALLVMAHLIVDIQRNPVLVKIVPSDPMDVLEAVLMSIKIKRMVSEGKAPSPEDVAKAKSELEELLKRVGS